MLIIIILVLGLGDNAGGGTGVWARLHGINGRNMDGIIKELRKMAKKMV